MGISLPVMSDVQVPPSQADRPTTDIDQGWVANAPMLIPRDEAGFAPSVPTGGEATGSAQKDVSPTFENTGDPLLLIGRRGGRRRRDERAVSFDLDSFQ